MNLKITSIKELLKSKNLSTYTISDKEQKLDKLNKSLQNYRKIIQEKNQNCSSEQNQVNIIKEFLLSISEYIFETDHDKIDLSIWNDKKLKVIIEAKRISNTEMITDDSVNKKAFQEALFYYMEQTQLKNQHEISQIIITDFINIYLFSEKEFLNLVSKSPIKKAFDTYQKDKDGFYKKISTISLNHIITATKINLFDEELDCESLYRIFDEHCLFNKPLTNKDHNILNEEFYNELLYIMGLYETIEKNIPVIKPLHIDSPDNNSFVKMVREKIDHTKIYPVLWSSLGETQEERAESMALELVLTWTNRILFLKLLEAQLIKYHDDKDKFKFLDYKKLSNWQEVSTLFFDILAKPTYSRDRKEIPYLNSSLFEKTEYENIIGIDSFNPSNKLVIFKDTILKDKKNLTTLEYLLEFLDAYNFGRGDDEVSESKRLINASVLGLIFEKLNGYKDGAVYTPSFITMSMSRESLRKTVIQKFNDTYGWDCQNFEDLKSKVKREDDLLALNKVFNSLTICDPAVGSGHFLVSVLNELLLIKYQLKILCDKQGEPISRCNMNIIADELLITYGGKDFAYRVDKDNKAISEDLQQIQETLFHEKETLIENCLFGVDINPKSAYICQLRLWIELLKNTYYIQNNTKIENLQILPNIDINIKTGNSLVSRFGLKQDFSLILNALKGRGISMEHYRELVSQYKNSMNKEEKAQAKKEIANIKATLKEKFLTNDVEYDKLVFKHKTAINDFEIAEKDLFNVDKIKLEELQKKIDEAKAKRDKADDQYKNSLEWRYEFPEVLDDEGNFIGFDLVIGNPPYFRYHKQHHSHISQINHFRNHELYNVACVGKINAYEVFLMLSYQLCKKNGFICEIFQQSFLGDNASKGVRKFYFEKTNILNINSFPERDSSKKRVFDKVKMSVMILLCQKNHETSTFPMNIYSDRMETAPKEITVDTNIIKTIDSEGMEIPNLNETELKVFAKCYENNNTLDHYVDIYEGELNLTFCKKYFTEDDTKIPFLVGANIQKYFVTDTPSQRTVPLYFDKEKYQQENSGAKSQHYKYERIIYQGITGVDDKHRLLASIENNVYCANTIDYLILKKTTSIQSHYLLGLMNSWLLNWLFKARSTNAHTNTYEIKRLPIPHATPEQQQPIIALVQQCMTAKAHDKNADISEYQSKIDDLVYQLYGLSKGEIKIVEGS